MQWRHMIENIPTGDVLTKTKYCALKLWIHSRIYPTPDSDLYINFLSFAVVISSPSDSRFRISLLWNHTSLYMNKSNQRAIYPQDIQGINIQSIHVYKILHYTLRWLIWKNWSNFKIWRTNLVRENASRAESSCQGGPWVGGLWHWPGLIESIRIRHRLEKYRDLLSNKCYSNIMIGNPLSLQEFVC